MLRFTRTLLLPFGKLRIMMSGKGFVMQWDREYHTVILTVPLQNVGKYTHRGKFLYLDKGRCPEGPVLLAPRTGGGSETP